MASIDVAPASAEKSVKKGSSTPKKAKSTAPRKPRPEPLHPSYLQMIAEAIAALKERTGSSQIAIAKYIEAKYKGVLPANFKKILGVQLRNLVQQNKLVKVKASYKLSEEVKKQVAPKKLKKVTGEAAPKRVTKKVVPKPRTTPKKVKLSKAGKPVKKSAPISGKRTSKTSTMKTAAAIKAAPAKKATAKKPAAKKSPAKSVLKPKAVTATAAKRPSKAQTKKPAKSAITSVKSPKAKKPVTKRARKA